MEFEVGDQVMHPTHGLGQITAIKHIELVEGFEHYYEISIPEAALQINIPMRKAEELGLRPIMKETRVDRVLETLAAAPEALNDHYRSRQADVESKLRSGDPIALAEAVRDLHRRKVEDSLTRRDSQLLHEAEEMLATEISATMEMSLEEALTTIEERLDAHHGPAEPGD
ncbi:MAG: hypothetical protein KDD73_10480 [Anaerolineales bacterium]|nr:hypothetical protein [Anaerolineales bacterium]MCB9128209.1 hypothetical protein [Ardenticatenales bacterium]